MSRYKIAIPFSGFYGSIHADYVDQAYDTYLEPDEDHPERADMTCDDLVFDMKGFMKEYAEEYLTVLCDELENSTDFRIELQLCEINSPKEYNFETDQLIAWIDDESLLALADNVCWANLETEIEEALKPRSGFHSSRSRRLSEWLIRGFGNWDYIELGFMLEHFVDIQADCWSDLYVELGGEIAYRYLEEKADA